MASSFGVKSQQSASRAYIRSPSPYASSRFTFSSRSSTSLSRSSSPKPVTVSGKPMSASSSSAINRSSASPGCSISYRKLHGNNANAVPSNKKRACMCSPTTHPGSFRCSHHKNPKYSVNSANHSQFQNEPVRSSSSSTLNLRESAMKNSIETNIVGVEGDDLAKRALLAWIRHSSQQHPRRSAFRPRPSRLSVMSKAED